MSLQTSNEGRAQQLFRTLLSEASLSFHLPPLQMGALTVVVIRSSRGENVIFVGCSLWLGPYLNEV